MSRDVGGRSRSTLAGGLACPWGLALGRPRKPPPAYSRVPQNSRVDVFIGDGGPSSRRGRTARKRKREKKAALGTTPTLRPPNSKCLKSRGKRTWCPAKWPPAQRPPPGSLLDPAEAPTPRDRRSMVVKASSGRRGCRSPASPAYYCQSPFPPTHPPAYPHGPGCVRTQSPDSRQVQSPYPPPYY